MGALQGHQMPPPHDAPMLLFDNLVKNLTSYQLQTVIFIHLHWKYLLIIC